MEAPESPESPESIERMLQTRLVPGAMSGQGSAALESLIDDLAEDKARPRPKWRGYVMGGIAAGVALLAAIMIAMPKVEVAPMAGIEGLFSEVRDVVLLENLEGVVSAEPNEHLVAGADGSLHRAWHVQVVSEERFHDEESGEEVRVVRPRDELVLMPVTSF